MIPALQMIPSIGMFNALTVATAARTEAEHCDALLLHRWSPAE
jgi:hypothetical protein